MHLKIHIGLLQSAKKKEKVFGRLQCPDLNMTEKQTLKEQHERAKGPKSSQNEALNRKNDQKSPKQKIHNTATVNSTSKLSY